MHNTTPIFDKIMYDSGNCRTYYHERSDTRRTKALYCRYDNEDVIYRCSLDGEPSHQIGRTQYVNTNKKEGNAMLYNDKRMQLHLRKTVDQYISMGFKVTKRDPVVVSRGTRESVIELVGEHVVIKNHEPVKGNVHEEQ